VPFESLGAAEFFRGLKRPTHSADFIGSAKAVPLLQSRSAEFFRKL
jgi:hypothetical protein